MPAEKISSILRRKNKETPESQLIKHEDKSWSERVSISRKHPHTLEYTKAVDAAKDLLKQDYTSEEIEAMGEKELSSRYPEITDPATIAGAAYQYIETKRFEQKQ